MLSLFYFKWTAEMFAELLCKVAGVKDLVLCLQAASGSDVFCFSASVSRVSCVPRKSGWLVLLGMLSDKIMEVWYC